MQRSDWGHNVCKQQAKTTTTKTEAPESVIPVNRPRPGSWRQIKSKKRWPKSENDWSTFRQELDSTCLALTYSSGKRGKYVGLSWNSVSDQSVVKLVTQGTALVRK